MNTNRAGNIKNYKDQDDNMIHNKRPNKRPSIGYVNGHPKATINITVHINFY